MDETFDLAIVGAGLAALSALRAGAAAGRIAIFDYQDAAGGLLRPALPAPGFAAEWQVLQTPLDPADVTLYTMTTAIGLLPAAAAGSPHTLLLRGRAGTRRVRATRVLLACGGLELTREHAQIAGTRPAGVVTPCLVHQLLARGYLPGRRCVVYGAGRYALATAQRLAEAGAQVTVVPPQGQAPPEAPAALRVEAPAAIARVDGFPRLARITLRREEQQVDLAADTLVYGAGMIANTGWLKGSGVDLDAAGAVRVDPEYRTSVDGVYAIGAVVAPCVDHDRSVAMGAEVARVLQR
jgi:thioredoxin reductase